MHFTRLALAMMTGLTLAAAAPAEQNANAALGCPNGWNICGTCNGSSCKAGGINYSCVSGTSCEGEGGGDGVLCGSSGGFGPQTCPVKTN